MFSLFVVFLLATGIVADSVTSEPNSRTFLDTVNSQLDNLKQNISRTLTASRERLDAINRKYSSADSLLELSVPDPLSPMYILAGEEEKDKRFTLCSRPTDGDNIYRYSIPMLNESAGTLDFSKHRDVPILLVNVATFCESTIEYPQYNKLKQKYGDKLMIVGFPSNNFANQEPTDDATEIYNSIKYVRPGKGFVPAFPLTKRIDVNGDKTHPIYSFLKRSCPSTRNRYTKNEHFLLYKPRNARDIRWNFEKFLIHPVTGHAWKRYDQKTLPEEIIVDIDIMISAAAQHRTAKNDGFN